MGESRRFNTREREALFLAADGKCSRCGEILGPGWHADHVRPWSQGGVTDVVNGQALCAECNLRKGARLMDSHDADFDAFGFVFENRAFGPPEHLKIRDWQNESLATFITKLKAHVALNPHAQLRALLSAGVGSGKTYAAAQIASYLLNRGLVQRMVYVCPNRAIKRNVRRRFKEFGINLVDWSNQRHGHLDCLGEPATAEGAVITYQALASRPEYQRALCRKRTLVIFDEIHHLGDRREWGRGAIEAFGDTAAVVLGLSGTPYRTDNCEIPFVQYEPTVHDGIRKFKADYSYTLGRAIHEGHCRKPFFEWLDAEVVIPSPYDKGRTYTFQDRDISEELANLRLAGAVKADTESRRQALRRAIDLCREEKRKLIIFVGGDTSNPDATAVEDATRHLPKELASLGVDPAHIISVTSNQADALHKIETFGQSDAWILITVNMVSEGVDIPELSAALFLTSITAKSTTVQRIGRILRGKGSALILMFKDQRYVDLSLEMEKEITYEINTRRQPVEAPAGAEPGDPVYRPRREAAGIDAWVDGASSGSVYYSEDEKRAAGRYLEAHGWPQSREYLQIVLVQIRAGEIAPVTERKESA